MDLAGLLLLLLFGHALADGPLQPAGFADAKRPQNPSGANGRWILALGGHAVIHGGFVALVTGSALLGWAEVIAHAAIDWSKGRFGLSDIQDQLLHVACKGLWALLAITIIQGAY